MALQSWRFESGPENANLGEEESTGPDDVTRESFCFGDVTLFSLRFGLELQNRQTLRSHNSAKS